MKTIYTCIGYDSWVNSTKYGISFNLENINAFAMSLTNPIITKHNLKDKNEDLERFINNFLLLASN